MLTVTGLTNAEYLISSVALSIDEYYAGVGESPGVWAGRWAEGLGLSGVVEADQLRALVEGKHPCPVRIFWRGRGLVRCGVRPDFLGPEERVAVVGVGLGSRWRRWWRRRTGRRWRWRWGSWRSGPRWPGCSRRGCAGGWRRVVGWWPGSCTGRAGRAILSCTRTVWCRTWCGGAGDGRHVAFDGGPLFEWARAAGSVYQNQLQRSLSVRLGVCWGPDRNNTREMEGFSRAQLRAFSKRCCPDRGRAGGQRGAVRVAGAAHASGRRGVVGHPDGQGPLADAQPAGRAVAARSRTRSGWPSGPIWTGRCAGQPGLEAAGLGGDHPGPGRSRRWGCAPRSARFTHADVVEHICAICRAAGSTLEEIAALADRFVDSDLAVRLTPDDQPGRRKAAQWSTAGAPGHRGPHPGFDGHPGRAGGPGRQRQGGRGGAAVGAGLGTGPGGGGQDA